MGSLISVMQPILYFIEALSGEAERTCCLLLRVTLLSKP